MKTKETSIRVFGQRSITSSFLSCSSNPFKSSKQDAHRESLRSSHNSLSDFLDQKLAETSVLPGTVKRKSRPFSFPVGPRDLNGSIDGYILLDKGVDAETNRVINEVLFEQFKHTDIVSGEDAVSGSVAEVLTTSADDVQETRKRKNQFNVENIGKDRPGRNENGNALKHVVVLGGDPKPKQNGIKEILTDNKRPRPLYNHYANGCGWWDCNMEGFDSEEVGISDVWEGVGSTTFGGI